MAAPNDASAEAAGRLLAATRLSQTSTQEMDDACARFMGINRTDGRCLDLIDQFGTLTAGELADLSGLSSGAVTAVLDRLEASGYVVRGRDEHDRRVVNVTLTPIGKQVGESLYRPISLAGAASMGRLSIEDMHLIAGFLEWSATANHIAAGAVLRAVPPSAASLRHRVAAAQRFAAESESVAARIVSALDDRPGGTPRSGQAS